MKERITGAIVLVVFIVLVVPVFLDGPAEAPEMISETVVLPGQEGDTERRRQTIVLERDRAEPVPVASAPAPAKSEPLPAEPEPEPEPAKPAPQREPAAAEAAPEPAPARASSPPPATGNADSSLWAVQLGSFSNKANAERLAAELRGKGYAAFLSQLRASGDALHRVRIGPQKDRDGAEAVAARLAADGHEGQVVPHP